MSLAERLNRRLDRPARVDPWFGGAEVPGYSQPSAIDNTGYTIADPLAEQGDVPTYDDPTVRVVPGGALGEAGAGWRRADEADLYPQAEYIGRPHANREAPMPASGVEGDHAMAGLDTGLGPAPAMDRLDPGPTEYQGNPTRRILSDRAVYDDLYGSGRELGLDQSGNG